MSDTGKILFYTTPSHDVKVEVHLEDETFWMTQKRMGELFRVETNTINYHLKEVFKSGELDEEAVIRKIRITAEDGKKYLTNFYNLDAIISVGYRVNSAEATQFRIWATKTLKEFIIKGFVLDDERLKNGTHFGKDYFDELLEKIREIRASERRFYQKITGLNRIVSMYLDFAENQASRVVVMKMQDWVEKLDAFLEFNGYEILQNLGKVRKSIADKLAIEHYQEFRIRQDMEYESDFDKMVKRLKVK